MRLDDRILEQMLAIEEQMDAINGVTWPFRHLSGDRPVAVFGKWGMGNFELKYI